MASKYVLYLAIRIVDVLFNLETTRPPLNINAKNQGSILVLILFEITQYTLLLVP